MAWSFVNSYTSTGNKSSSTPDTATVTANVDDTLVIIAGCQSIASVEAIGTTAITDSGSNTYTRRASDQFIGTGSSAVAIFTTTVSSALSSGTVTFTPGSSVTAKNFIVLRYTGGSETVRDATTNSGNSGSYGVATTTDPQSGDLVVAGVAVRHSTTTGYTEDSDTTNGSWSTTVTVNTTGGAGGSNTTTREQYKITTGTGNQDWAATGQSAQWRAAIVALEPSAGAPSSLPSSVGILIC